MENKIINPDLSKFKSAVYPAIAYFDNTFDMLGKFENNPASIKVNGPFSENNKSTTFKGFIDGGDSAFHLGHYITAIALLRKNGINPIINVPPRLLDPAYLVPKLYKGYGVYCRHPDAAMWYSGWFTFSRDQSGGLLAAEAYTKGSLWRMVAHIINHGVTRLFLFDAKLRKNGWNNSWKFPTLTGPTVWATYLRYFMVKFKPAYVLYPLLLILDIEVPLSLWVKQSIEKEDDDVLNHISHSIWFHEVAPTPWTWLNLKLMNTENWIDRLYKYFDDGRCAWFTCEMWVELLQIYSHRVKK